MLEAQGDLEVEDLFAVALEAEMARLDDARVDRSHGHFVDFFAFDAVEIPDGRQDRLSCFPVPCVAARP